MLEVDEALGIHKKSMFSYDLVSGSKITYDHLTDGIMWAQGLFSDCENHCAGTFQYHQLVFFKAFCVI